MANTTEPKIEVPKIEDLQRDIKELAKRLSDVEHRVEQKVAPAAAPVAQVPVEANPADILWINGQAPNIMPTVPTDWTVGRKVTRKGVQGETEIQGVNSGSGLIYVELDDNGEKKVIWAPFGDFTLVPE